MLRCNLAILMAERNLKITRVAKDTGISRTTLTALANNKGVGVQFATLNTLCSYFRINLNELVSFMSVDIAVKCVSLSEFLKGEAVFALTVLDRYSADECWLFADYAIELHETTGDVCNVKIYFFLKREHIFDDFMYLDSENEVLYEMFSSFSIPFFSDVEKMILNAFFEKWFADNGMRGIDENTISTDWESSLRPEN